MRFSIGMTVIGMGIAVTSAALLAVGCGDDGTSGTTSNATTSSSSGGAACEAKFPCSPVAAECCQAKAAECIPFTDNSAAAKPTLRMAQLTIKEPPVLATGTVANIVGNAVLANAEACNLAGSGTFSWGMEIDSATKMVKTGGMRPIADPTAESYCFVNEMLGGKQIAPVNFDSGLGADGKFSGKVGDIVVPIFLDAMATSYVLMPLKQVTLDGTISSDFNCIGKYNADKLETKLSCQPEPPDSYAFTEAGNLVGYITLEDADSVIVSSLHQSLCVLLSGDSAMYGDGGSPDVKCKRDANQKIVYPGKWCSTTNMAADAACSDAEHLIGTFAASAAKISGDCK